MAINSRDNQPPENQQKTIWSSFSAFMKFGILLPSKPQKSFFYQRKKSVNCLRSGAAWHFWGWSILFLPFSKQLPSELKDSRQHGRQVGPSALRSLWTSLTTTCSPLLKGLDSTLQITNAGRTGIGFLPLLWWESIGSIGQVIQTLCFRFHFSSLQILGPLIFETLSLFLSLWGTKTD